MSDRRYFQVVAILAALVWLAGAVNVFVAGMTIDRVTAGIGFALTIGAWVLVTYCAKRLRVMKA